MKKNLPRMIPGWHDLRRTFASVGSDLGLKGFMGELLGHAEQTVTDIYTRTAAQRLKEAARQSAQGLTASSRAPLTRGNRNPAQK